MIAIDAFSVPIGRPEFDRSAASTSDTYEGNRENHPAIVWDGIRRLLPFMVVLERVFVSKTKPSRKSESHLCWFGVDSTRRGLVGLKYFSKVWKSKATLVCFEVYS